MNYFFIIFAVCFESMFWWNMNYSYGSPSFKNWILQIFLPNILIHDKNAICPNFWKASQNHDVEEYPKFTVGMMIFLGRILIHSLYTHIFLWLCPICWFKSLPMTALSPRAIQVLTFARFLCRFVSKRVTADLSSFTASHHLFYELIILISVANKSYWRSFHAIKGFFSTYLILLLKLLGISSATSHFFVVLR